MSSAQNTTIRRRLRLFTGSSLAAAGLGAAASFGAAALAPTAVLAQTCDPAPAVVAATAADDSVACTLALYPSGVTYTTNGDLTVTTTVDAAEWGGSGIVLNGVGNDSITFDTVAPVSGGLQTPREIEGRLLVGALVDITTVSGRIDVRTEEVDADAHNGAGVTHGIRARSTTGSIDISTIGTVAANSLVSGNSIGIEGVTGGAGTVDITLGDLTTTSGGQVSGRLHGIYARAVDGDVTIDAHRSASAFLAGGAAIDAASGAGLTTINVEGVARVNGSGGASATINGSADAAGIRTQGDALITIGPNASVAGLWGVDALVAGGETVRVEIRNHAPDFDANNDGRLTRFRASGDGEFILDNDGAMRGAADLSGLTSGATINIAENGAWFTQGGAIEFGPGDDVLTTAAGGEDSVGGIIFTGLRSGCSNSDPTCQATFLADPDQVIDFGEPLAGNEDVDRFDNKGFFIIHPTPNNNQERASERSFFEANTVLLGLEVFNNSGTIMLGGIDDGEGEQSGASQLATGRAGGMRTDEVAATDGWYDDVLSMPGTTLVSDGGEIVFDIDLMRTQTSCTERNAEGDLGAADCVMIVGGATEGTTYVTLREIIPGDAGSYNPEGILLVDMTGGTSAQGDFVVGPNTPGYNANFGGVLDKGAFTYAIVYDEAAQQHVLFSMPSGSAQQFPVLATAAQGLWRVSTGSWLERQADLRGDLDDGIGGGVWLRVSGEAAERDLIQPIQLAGQTFDWDNTYSQNSYAVTGGIDLMAASQGDTAYVVGVMAGYAHAEVEYDASPNIGRLDGFTGGLYASFLSGGLFVDAAVNANRLDLENDVPGFNLFPAGTILSTDLVSIGGQVEAGWRLPLANGAFVEPLAGASYVRTKYDDLSIPADDPSRPRTGVEFDDPTSLRASLGGRVGLEQDYGAVRAQFSGLVRVWNEFEGENRVILHSQGPDIAVLDDFSGRFTELGLSASVYSAGGLVSGFLNVGGKFNDDYQATTASAGVRVAW